MAEDDTFRLEADIDDGAVSVPAHHFAFNDFAPLR